MRYLIYGLMVAVSVFFDIRLIYILFIVLLLFHRKEFGRSMDELFLSIAVASVILPDNYSTEVCFLLYFLVCYVPNHCRKIKITPYITILLVFLFELSLSTVINLVPTVNIFFSIVSFFPLFAMLFMLPHFNRKGSINLKYIIDDIFAIEFFSMIFNFIFYHSSISDDWSSGTFFRVGGTQALLFILSTFLSIFYFTCYMKKGKNRNDLYRGIGSVAILISTNCWTLIVFFVLGIGVTYLLTLSPKRLLKVAMGICCIPIMFHFILYYTPSNVSEPLQKIMTDSEYFRYRVYKAEVYRTTFIETPSQDLRFALIGNGIGNYNSRAALICTGYYVDSYNKLFDSSISDYTNKNILTYLQYSFMYGESDFGSVLSRPYSSITALMGECGYIGFLLFLLVIKKIIKNRKFEIRLLIFVWLSFCFVENYFEYAKVITLLYALLLLMYKETDFLIDETNYKIKNY